MALNKLALTALLVCPVVALGCDYPDEGTMPLHRAVTKVKLLPPTQAWSADWLRQKVVVQYALLLEQTRMFNGRCYWTVEARAAGSTWRRYFVSPDGKRVLSEDGRPAGAAPRTATASPAATAQAR